MRKAPHKTVKRFSRNGLYLNLHSARQLEHDPVLAVPDLRAVPSAAAAAADLPGEYGCPTMFWIAGSLGENILDQRKLIRRDDGRVAVFHIVLRHRAVIGHCLFCQEIRCESLLLQSTAFVLFVFQDAPHRAFVPFLPAGR